MRDSLHYQMPNIAPYGVMLEEVKQVLNNPPMFGFGVLNIVEQEEQDPIVSYPEISSNEPVVSGSVDMDLNYALHGNIYSCVAPLESPTWKMLLDLINETIRELGLPYADLHTIDIVGLINEGMGYKLQAILI